MVRLGTVEGCIQNVTFYPIIVCLLRPFLGYVILRSRSRFTCPRVSARNPFAPKRRQKRECVVRWDKLNGPCMCKWAHNIPCPTLFTPSISSAIATNCHRPRHSIHCTYSVLFRVTISFICPFLIMLLSIPSSLDAGGATEHLEDVQIEISMDIDSYSILVTSEDLGVQSVVTVPREVSSGRRRQRVRRVKQLTGLGVFGLPPRSPTSKVNPDRGRKADYMRPMSPLKRGRSCVVEDRHSAENRPSRSRQVVLSRSASCPAPVIRPDSSPRLDLTPVKTIMEGSHFAQASLGIRSLRQLQRGNHIVIPSVF
jgi:hypothetical protein